MPTLVGGGGELVSKSGGMADLLSDHFDSKQSRESVDLPLTCHPSPSLITFAFSSSEVKRLLLDLDPCRSTHSSLGTPGHRRLYPLPSYIESDI